MNYYQRLFTYIRAIRGDAESQYRIACYLISKQDPSTKDRAHQWFKYSAQQGHTNACIYLVKHSIGVNNTNDAIEYLRLGTPTEDCLLESLLGQMLLNGYTNYIDLQKAQHANDLDQYVASLSSPSPTLNLNDADVYKDLLEAISLLKKGINKQNPLAYHALAVYTLEYKSDATDQDRLEALKWLNNAAEDSFAPSLQTLAGIYENGLFGTAINIEKGLQLRIEAAKSGSKDAQYSLGVLLYKGNGFEPNKKQGLNLIKMAARQGHHEANDFLKLIHFKE